MSDQSPTRRQALWDLLRTEGTLTPAAAAEAGIPLNTARMYFAEWKRNGAIVLDHQDGKTRFFRAAQDTAEAPREIRTEVAEDDPRAHRQIAWDLLCEAETVSVPDLIEIGLHRNTAELALNHWLEAEAIRFSHRDGKVRFYTRVLDTDTAPAFTRSDHRLAPRERRAKKLWTAARMLKTFTPRDVAAHAATSETEVSIDDATRFCRMLLRAGYVRVLRKARPSDGVEPRYRLTRDTGPKPPIEKRVRAVWDENEGCFTHLPETAS
ncbi:hypothetical protein SAMN05421853_10281 [Roseivivax halotolerans]|uniref:Uncharacterized protein n=1 Tax=Roseivivax halotolerans TaxID=93684 RepID=A0A1I5W212_9RHOB|nr:hypothetical protein [Roseivivax halotolerans]SFQ13782.1 hypothetical protein SAMN05421853_10281 [Roseivivax halotolerans]